MSKQKEKYQQANGKPGYAAKSQGGRNSNRRSERVSKRITNDFAWWNKYPTLTAGAGEFPFNQVRGTVLNLDGYADNVGNGRALPTIMKLGYIPTIGRSVSSESPFMTQVRTLWLDMHRKFRGIGTYQVSDLGVFLFCAINLFAEISRAERIYGYFRGAQATDRSIPYTLLNACGVAYEDTVTKLADFRFAINEINQKAATICLPKGFSAYEDAVTLANCTVKDSDSKRCGYYVFDSEVYYTWSGTVYSTGSAAISHYRKQSILINGRTLQSMQDIIDDLNTQLTAMLTDDDCARMASDILAAYGENGVETRTSIGEDYITPIERDDKRLLQIHNATIAGGRVGTAQWRPSNILPAGVTGTPGAPHLDITQSGNVLYSELFLTPTTALPHVVSAAEQAQCPDLKIPSIAGGTYTVYTDVSTVHTSGSPMRLNDRVVDTWADDVSLDDKVEMTRYTIPTIYGCYMPATPSSTDVPWDWIKLRSFGCNVITSCTLFRKSGVGLDIFTPDDQSQCTQMTSTLNPTKLGFTQFDWHPIMYIYLGITSWAPPYATDSLNYQEVELVGDIDHLTVLKDSSEILDKLHEAALMSAYRCENTQTSKFDLT